MAYLKQLLKNCNYMCLQGSVDCKVAAVCYESGKVQRGDMFVCLKGQYRDGHDYLAEAVRRGASVCVVQKMVCVPENVTVIRVRNTRAALAQISAEYFGNPSKQLRMIGITGTKGKTTTACMSAHMLREAGYKVGVIGTIGIEINQQQRTFYNTTPESYVIQQSLRQMADAGCDFCVMEVSSQGIKAHRVDGITFDIGVFTNISPDHIGIGEHADFAEYLYYKSRIFERSRIGIVNADDVYARRAARKALCRIRSYGIKTRADYRASDITYQTYPDCLGMEYQLCGACQEQIAVGMPGIYNIYNSLAAIAICHMAGITGHFFENGLRTIHVKGRMEELHVSKDYRLVIDYAHNAQSLRNLLSTLRFYHPKRLVTLFGCGGNRSKLRRYQMGEAAGELSDYTILTSDNPRYEPPESILDDIERGMKKTAGEYVRIADRRAAIAYAVKHAQPGDLIVLAGKGHEDYQEIAGNFYPMDERNIIDEIVRQYHY